MRRSKQSIALAIVAGAALTALATVLNTHKTLEPDMTEHDQTIELVYNPNKQAEIGHAIIWLHGLGATSNDFPPVVPHLGLDPQRAIRFIFPQAPNRPISINGGMSMPGWYDIKGINIEEKEDLQGMRESQATLEALIQAQIDLGVPSENIIIAGFSQGGAVAYYTALRSAHKLAGLLALSTYMPFSKQAAEEHSGVNTAIAVFVAHGDHDPVVPVALGKASLSALQALGYSATWKTYAMEHQVNMDQLQDIGAWINRTYDAPISSTNNY